MNKTQYKPSKSLERNDSNEEEMSKIGGKDVDVYPEENRICISKRDELLLPWEGSLEMNAAASSSTGWFYWWLQTGGVTPCTRWPSTSHGPHRLPHRTLGHRNTCLIWVVLGGCAPKRCSWAGRCYLVGRVLRFGRGYKEAA